MDQSGFREVFEALLNEYEAQGMGKSAAAAAALREATTQSNPNAPKTTNCAAMPMANAQISLVTSVTT